MNAFSLNRWVPHRPYKLGLLIKEVKCVRYFKMCIHTIKQLLCKMKNVSGLQLYLQDGSEHAGSDAVSLPSHQAAADWLKSTLKEADAFLTFRLLTHQHTLT